MAKKNRRKLQREVSRLYGFVIFYAFMSLGVRIVLMALDWKGKKEAILFGFIWAAATLVSVFDKRVSRRSRSSVYSSIVLMLAVPAICALMLGYPVWGMAGFAETALWLFVLSKARTGEK